MSLISKIYSIAKDIIKAVVIAAIILFVIVMIFAFFIGASPNSCQKDSKVVEFAMSLSDEQLEKLFNDMQKHWRSFDAPDQGYIRGSEPKEFSYLNASFVRPRKMHIMLEGCFDEYVYLGFHGFTLEPHDPVKEQIVKIQYHDKEKIVREILWENTKLLDSIE